MGNCTTLKKTPTNTTTISNNPEDIYLNAITLVQKHFRLYLFHKSQKQKNLIKQLQTPNLQFSSISKQNFKNIIHNKIRETLKGVISFDNLDGYTIDNYHDLLLDIKNINKNEVFSQFQNFRIKLEPLMITNLANPSDLEFYWGEWNYSGKKDGFGIKIFSNGNFYFGTFKNNKMHGLGLYAYADNSARINCFDIKKRENLFLIKSYFSKNFSDLEADSAEENTLMPTSDEKLRELLVETFNEKKDYFLYIGQFSENKFEGFGDVYDKAQNHYWGKFKSNKLNEEGQFKFREKIKSEVY